MKQQAWRPPAADDPATRRWTQRLFPMSLVVGAALVFFFILYEPFYHPRVYLLFAAAEYPESLIPGYVAAAEDLAMLPAGQIELLNDAEAESPQVAISSAAALDAILDQLDHHDVQNRDVLIVWVRGQAITSGGQVNLVCGDFDPQNVQAGTYSLSRLLERVGQCPAKSKLVVLDTGRLAHAPRLGIFAECSPRMIRETVTGTNDPTLWVLLSHSELETSHELAEPRCSALAQFAGDGIRGAADEDQDRFVDLAELREYVQGQLDSRMAGPPGEQESQTTALVWGGGEITATARYPRLAPVAPPKLIDTSKALAEASKRPLPGPLSKLQKKDATEKPAPDEKSAGPELLAEAWSLHDRLAASPQLRPVEAAPHLFRALQDELRGLDSSLRSGDKPAEIATLRRLIGQMKDLAEGRTPQRFDRHDLIADLAEFSEKLNLGAAAHSLAMAELAAKHGGPALPPEILTAATRLDALAASGERAEFEKWSAGLPTKLDSFVEFRLVRTLAGRRDLSWPSIQLALRACRLAEAAAAETLESGDWTRPLNDHSDRLRLAAERSLLYPVRTDDMSRATTLFQQAIAGYERAAAAAREVVMLQARANEAMFCLFACLRWSIGSLAVESEAPGPAELSELINDLSEATALLDHPSAAGLADLGRVRRQLELELDGLRQRMAVCESRRAALKSADGKSPQVARAENSAAGTRLRLMKLGDPQDVPDAERRGPANPASPQDRLRRLRQWADLYGRAVQLFLADVRLESGTTLRVVSSRLGEPCHTAAKVALDAASTLQASGGTKEAWEACSRLGDALREFYRAVPSAIDKLSADNRDLTDPAGRAEKIRTLRSARRMLYLVDPWDVERMEPASPSQLLRAAHLYDLLAWQEQRLRVARDDAPTSDLQYLADAMAAFRQAAMSIPLQPSIEAIGLPLIEIETAAKIDLAEKPEHELPVTVINRDKRPAEVWLMADYDPALLDVAARSDQTLYDQPKMQTAAGGTPAIRDALRPTFQVQAGEKRLLWVNVRRKALASADARLVVRAISLADYVRHEVMVELARQPPVELVLEGAAGSWERTESGLVLYPLPNRVSSYKLGLVNTTAEDKQVSFEILRVDDAASAPLPLGEVSAATADECLAKLKVAGRVARVEQVAVPAGRKLVPISFLPAPGEKPKEQPKPASGAAEKPKEKEEAKPDSSKETPPLSRNLVAVVNDRATGRRSIQRIEILTQRPARFLVPRAEFDPKQQRVEILVRAADAATIPAEGIWIEAEPEIRQPDETPHRQRAMLRPPAAEARLFVEVPPDAGPMFPIVVHIDGFERAFRYEVPTDVGSPTVVPRSNRVAIRILKPKAGAAYGPKPAEIEAALEVDAPRGLVLDGTSSVEIGIDADRDRELRGEESLLLTSDRQVKLSAEVLGEDGTLAIRTQVGDLRVTLPPPKVKDIRANLIARVRLPDGDVWSDPIELIFDSQPPRVGQLQMFPDATIVQGTGLDLSVFASDGELSGVAKVEAAIDVQRTGEFSLAPPPESGSPQPDGRWAVKLATEKLNPGVWNVLVRATDRQGNTSEYLKAPIKVISKEAMEAHKPGPNRIRGHVIYGRFEKSPVAGALVRLVAKVDPKAVEPKSEQPSYEAKTDKNGQFTIEHVVLGQYELSAEALVGGNRRSGQTSLKVPPSPTEIEPVELLLR